MDAVACFTGHRPSPAMRFEPARVDTRLLAQRTDDAICLLCLERGVETFLCGMAAGFDLFAASRLLTLRRQGAIPEKTALIAVLPYPEHALDLPSSWADLHREVLQCAQDQCIVSLRRGTGVFLRRNEFLVEHAGYVLAYWNHNSRTGTGQTVRLAQRSDRVIVNLFDL